MDCPAGNHEISETNRAVSTHVDTGWMASWKIQALGRTILLVLRCDYVSKVVPMNFESGSARTLFQDAVEKIPPEQWPQFVESACHGDEPLRREVLRLLQAHAQVDSFMAQPVGGLPAAMAATIYMPQISDMPQVSERPGQTIGPYKLLEQIGEGGFGVVFMAEQTQPFRRKVALKVLKPGVDTRQVIARFEAERQALALMDHINIARVIDAGATDAGRPYFVMELVNGIPITDYCDQARLTTRERLELFVAICRAVQHAHQKGIIHRDLKPSNVLVTLHDGTPLVKVIDFGIAKATGQQLTEKTLFTGFGQLIGTPMYMSPEQAALSHIDVDTRSDVYSLGVLLFYLLSGTTPFDKETLSKASFDELRRIIREDEPPCPSARISTLEAHALSTVSGKRGIDELQFKRLLVGELDWVVMKALEKDRNRRYETASAFAADIDRYLKDEPVEACPPSMMYRVRKMARRNKVALAVAGLVLFFLVVLGSGIGWAVRDQAARTSETVRAVSLALDEADYFEQRGTWPDALAAAQRAKTLVDSQSGDEGLRARVRQRKDDLAMVLRLEEIRLEMAAVKNDEFDWSLGDHLYADAFRNYGIDVEVGESADVARQIPAGPVQVEFVAALDHWAWVRRTISRDDPGWKRLLAVASAADPDPWRNHIRKALTDRDFKALKELQASAPLGDHMHPSEIILLNTIIMSREVWDVLREAQRRRPNDFWLNHTLGMHFAQANPPQWSESLGFYRAALAVRPESPGVLLNLGNVLAGIGRLDEAIAANEQAIRINPDYASAHNNLGKTLAAKGALDDAITAFRQAISLKPDYTMAHYNLGTTFFLKGEFDEAVAALREAVRLKPHDAAAVHNNLGNALKKTGALDEAEDAFRTAIRLQPDQAQAYNGLGGLLCDDRANYDGAIAAFRRAIELRPDEADFHHNLGRALTEKGDLDEAVTAYRQAILDNPDDPGILSSFGDALIKKGSPDEAIAVLRKAIQLQPDLADAHNNLGNALAGQGELDDAIIAYQSAQRLQPDDFKAYINLSIAFMHKRAWDEAITAATEAIRCKPDLAEAHCNLGHALRENGRLREALEALRRGHELGSRNPRWSYPSALWVEECQRLIELGSRPFPQNSGNL